MSFIKYIINMAMYHNPFDAYVNWHRKHLAKKGPEAVYKYDQMIYWRVGYIFFPKILKLTNKFTWSGQENLKDFHGPFMVICNHNDSLDPFFAGAALSCGTRRKEIHVSWVSKLANLHTPLMKSIIKYFGTISLAPGRKLSAETRQSIEAAIAHKQGIGFFPEGGRSKDRSQIREFHAGAARLCLEYKLPYVPVCLTGKRFFFKGKSSARIGKPVYIDPKVACTYDNAAAVAQDMQAQVKALYEGLTDQPRGRYEIPKETPVIERPQYLPAKTLAQVEIPLHAPAPTIYRSSARAIDPHQHFPGQADATSRITTTERPDINPAPRRLERDE
jgi:1-acyl-sn-glycerol-3-phosphate acyltransferase